MEKPERAVDTADGGGNWPGARIRPRTRHGGLLTRHAHRDPDRRLDTARRRTEEAIQARRSGLAWMIRASLVTSVVIIPLGLVGAHTNLGELAQAPVAEWAPSFLCFALFSVVIGATAVVGACANTRENAALGRLRRATRHLSIGQARELASELRQLPGDHHQEALSVVLEALAGEPAHLVPASPPGPVRRELAPPSWEEPCLPEAGAP